VETGGGCNPRLVAWEHGCTSDIRFFEKILQKKSIKLDGRRPWHIPGSNKAKFCSKSRCY
jgi:hypothetical protein